MWNKPLKHSNHRTLVRKPSHLISFHGNFFESLFGTFCCKSHRIYMHGKNPAYALCIHLGVGGMLIKVRLVSHIYFIPIKSHSLSSACWWYDVYGQKFCIGAHGEQSELPNCSIPYIKVKHTAFDWLVYCGWCVISKYNARHSQQPKCFKPAVRSVSECSSLLPNQICT